MVHTRLKSIQLSNGETLGYREREGGHEIVLLIHGNMSSSKHWDLVIDNIDSNLKLYAVDMRGFGISTYNSPINSLADFASDIKLWTDALGLKSFSIIGWSTGGGVAMQFASDYPGMVKKLILIASVSTRGYPYYHVDAQGSSDIRRRVRSKEEIAQLSNFQLVGEANENKDKDFMRGLFNTVIYTMKRPSEERYEEYIEDILTQRNLFDVYHALNTFNISEIDHDAGIGSGGVRNIDSPTMVIWGNNDLVISESMTNEIMEDLAPIAKLITLDNCGHSPLIDDLENLLEIVAEFIWD